MSAIVHQVLLADLGDLAEILEISDDNLGLKITFDGELVPVFVGAEDDAASLSEMKEVARSYFPDSHELDLVILIHEAPGGNRLAISTLDRICLMPSAVKSCWWTFTDTYRDRMQ